MKILITGASGFVGRSLRQRIFSYDCFRQEDIYSVLRHHSSFREPPCASLKNLVFIDELSDLVRMKDLLSTIDCIVHLAARVHQMKDQVSDPLAEFRSINTTATYNLAQAAVKAGVRRFIYLSSVKVHGEERLKPYTETDRPSPSDPYGISKCEAEEQLKQLANQTGLEVVILRPPLIYGPGVKANFLNMMRMVKKGIPLPLASIHNRRSLVYVENLADAIITAAIHPAAANETFLVSDGEDTSTPHLIRNIAEVLHRPSRLLPVPVSWLKILGKLTGKSNAIDRLVGSLFVDSSHIRKTLNWTPPYTLSEGLQATADWYLDRSS